MPIITTIAEVKTIKLIALGFLVNNTPIIIVA